MVSISYWVMTASELTAMGTYEETVLSVMTTPAAWIEILRGMPSSARAVSISFSIFGEFSYMSLRSFDSIAPASVMPGPRGIRRATASTSPYGIPRARPTSRIAARAASVPKVII